MRWRKGMACGSLQREPVWIDLESHLIFPLVRAYRKHLADTLDTLPGELESLDSEQQHSVDRRPSYAAATVVLCPPPGVEATAVRVKRPHGTCRQITL